MLDKLIIKHYHKQMVKCTNLLNKKSWFSFSALAIFTVVLFITLFVITPTAVFGENEDIVAGLGPLAQWDGSTLISEGWIVRHPAISFSADIITHVSAPEGRLQVELRRFEELFTGINDGGILTSDLVPAGWTARITKMGISDGKYHWRARAVDSAGHVSGWQEFGSAGNVDFEIRTNELPTASFTFEPSNPIAGEEISFDASGSSDPNGAITLYGWDWDGDGNPDEYHDVPFAKHSWIFAGIYNVGLRVTDNKGATSFFSDLILVEEPAPGIYSASIGQTKVFEFIPWLGELAWSLIDEDYDLMDEIDEWLRDKNGDNKPDSDSKPYEWLRGTKCAGNSTILSKKGCLILALNQEMNDGSEITYKDYVISVVREELLVDKAFRKKASEYPLSVLTKLLPGIPKIFLNDLTTAGVEKITEEILISKGFVDLIGLHKFGTTGLSLIFTAVKLDAIDKEIDKIQYTDALMNYFRCRRERINEPHETAWSGSCVTGLESPQTILQSAGITDGLLHETGEKFNEWWIKYHDEMKTRYGRDEGNWNWFNGLPIEFRKDSRESVKNLILSALGAKSK